MSSVSHVKSSKSIAKSSSSSLPPVLCVDGGASVGFSTAEACGVLFSFTAGFGIPASAPLSVALEVEKVAQAHPALHSLNDHRSNRATKPKIVFYKYSTYSSLQ